MQPFLGFFLAGVFYLWWKGRKQGQNTPAEGGQAYCKLLLSPSVFFFVLMFRRMCPKFRFAFPVILSIWEFQDRPLEMSISKYLSLVTTFRI